MNPDDGRLEEIMAVILAIAGKDFHRRARVADGNDVLDGIAAGLNMLAEEADRQHKVETEYRSRLLRAERLAAIGTLAAGVAHEINNPAAFLLGNFEVLDELTAALRTEKDPARVSAIVDEIQTIARVGQEGVARIANIVRGLRNFSRIETGAVVPVRLDEIAEQACILVSREVIHRATLVKRVAAVPPIMGDRTKLMQIVTNLLLNAAQAIEEGDPTKHEVELVVEDRGAHVRIAVKDSGRGISAEHHARIFDPFFTTKESGQGTGLGLSVSADIARQHGGELRFESAPGGTTFELVLPKANGLVSTATPVPVVVTPAARQRVLFIDDEEQVLRSYRRMLARTHDVELAVGGVAALALLEKDKKWDAIVCDLLMPDVDGAGVFEWLEANAPQLTARLLFCSGGAFTTRGAAFAEEQRERLLDKPLSRAQLESAIARLQTA